MEKQHMPGALKPRVPQPSAADSLATPAAWGPVVRFDCERGRLDADLVFDKESVGLTSAKLSPADGETCVP